MKTKNQIKTALSVILIFALVCVFYITGYAKTGVPVITSTTTVANGVTVKWNKVKSNDSCTLYYKANNTWKKLVKTTSTSYTDTTVPKNSSRIYRVCCTATNGINSYSDTVTAKRLNTPSVSFYSKDKNIILKWSAVPNAEKYRVFYMVNGSWTIVGNTKITSCTVKATSGKDVIYTVRCISDDLKNYQSYFLPVSGRYTDYTFRSEKLNMAGNGSFTQAGGLNFAQQQAVFRYMNGYYSSIGSFKNTVSGICRTVALRDKEATLWDSVIAVRSRAIEDLSLTRFRYSLTVKDLKKLSASSVKFTLFENINQQFRDIPTVSQSFANEYWFTLTQNNNGTWLVSELSGDCSPFYNFKYDSVQKKDLSLAKALSCIKTRQATVGAQTGVDPVCDHPYNRTAAKNYMMQWIDKRNPAWFAYDAYGGNCMNFASQVLYAGGIHKTSDWNWSGTWNYTPSWIVVDNFADYAAKANSKQLYCNSYDNYYSGNIGDVVLIGIDSPRSHATVISDIIRNENGEAIDYLLCCNTTNHKNFPAAAYHYTNQQLIRIYGWNN